MAHDATRLCTRNYYSNPYYDEVYEYTLRFGDHYCRVVEDFHMQEMRMRMGVEEYNEYVTRRLIDMMLNFVNDGIKKAVQQQAANNAPQRNNMAYLFGDK